MTKAEQEINDAKAALTNRYATVSDKAGLSIAIDEAERARAAFCDVKNHLSAVLIHIKRTLEDGIPQLGLHGFHDEHYSKVTVAAASARFRNAMRDLRTRRAAFDRSCEDFRAILKAS